MATVGKGGAAIEYTNVIESEESSLKDVVTFGIFPIHPPGKGEQQFVEDRFQKSAVAFAGLFALDSENAPGCPRKVGVIYITDVPFIDRKLANGKLVPLAKYDIDVIIGKLWMN